MTETFPVIDLTDAAAGTRSRRLFLERLRFAAHEIGFFQLTGHGVDGGDRLLDHIRDFFALPAATKEELSILNSPHFRGYSAVGRELTRGIPDEREQLDVGPELPARMPRADQPAYYCLAGPNQWPAEMPELRLAVLDWTARLSDVARLLVRLLLESLAAPASFLDDLMTSDPHVHFKLLHYPGLRGDERAEAGQGVGIHKDYGLVTLLLQDSHGGLQVEVEPGRFVEVPSIPGAFVVNLGELIEVATRGYFRATTHRVVRPGLGVDRYSAPFFFNPRLDASMRPVPSRYVAAAKGASEDRHNPLWAGYGDNVMKGMLRAFPEVIARHHPYLLTGTAGSAGPAPEGSRER